MTSSCTVRTLVKSCAASLFLTALLRVLPRAGGSRNTKMPGMRGGVARSPCRNRTAKRMLTLQFCKNRRVIGSTSFPSSSCRESPSTIICTCHGSVRVPHCKVNARRSLKRCRPATHLLLILWHGAERVALDTQAGQARAVPEHLDHPLA